MEKTETKDGYKINYWHIAIFVGAMALAVFIGVTAASKANG